MKIANYNNAWATAFLCTLIAIATPVFSAEFNGYVSLTTDYVYRGVTRSDGNGAFQLGVDAAFDSGFYAGIWGSTVDIGDNVTRQRDREINYYGGYSKALSDKWILAGSIIVYRFPGAFGNLDYDHEEFSVSLNYNDQWWFEYAQSPDYYSTDSRTHTYEVFTEWPFLTNLSLSAGIGYFDVSDFVGNGYTYWQLGISRPLGPFDVDLRYHDTNRWVPRVSNPERAKARVVLSARFQF